MQSPQKSDSRNNFDTSLTMKRILTLLILTLLGSCPAVFGQEIALTTLQMQPGSNFQLGTTVQQVSLTGLNVRDQSAHLLYSIPLLSALSTTGSIQITDTVYAITPPDANNSTLVEILYQADPTQPINSTEITNAIADTLTQNSWVVAQTQIKVASVDDIFPAGTQFWACSSAGYVTFSANGGLSLAIVPQLDNPIFSSASVQVTPPSKD